MLSSFRSGPAVKMNRSTESDSEVDGRGGGGASHGTAAELEAAQGGVERSRFSPGRIAEFKQLASDPDVYNKVRALFFNQEECAFVFSQDCLFLLRFLVGLRLLTC